MKLQAGETWRVTGRKGDLTVKLLEPVDTDTDGFFNCELVQGRPVYLSGGRGADAPGDTLTLRTSLTRFVGKVVTDAGSSDPA